MIELSKAFVPATGEVGRLQSCGEPDCQFFQTMANQGHAGGREGSTRQGIYVCAPSGHFLASINHTSPEEVLKTMQEGLDAWQALPPDDRRLTDSGAVQARHRWEASFPADGLILQVFSRDLPASADPTAVCQPKWNQDQLWFSAAEAKRWMDEHAEVGTTYSVPDDLVARITRFHLVDNVRGETPSFRPAGVTNSQIIAEMVERSEQQIKLRFTGSTEGIAAEGWWQSPNGVVTQLRGQATFDRQQSRFVAFEIVALGRQWGHTRFNGRYGDQPNGPVGYVLRLAPEGTPPIASTHLAVYGADWVIYP